MTEAPPGHTNISKNALTKKEKYWQDHYNRCQQSGLSLAGYARSQGLVVKTFYAWHLRLRQRSLVNPKPVATPLHRVAVKQTEPLPVIETEPATLRFQRK